jgi:hypothetical protein
VPLTADGQLVVVNDVDVIEADPGFSFVGPIATALQLANRDSSSTSLLAASAAETTQASLLAEELALPPAEAAVAMAAVPEPSTVALGIASLMVAFTAGRRSRRQ